MDNFSDKSEISSTRGGVVGGYCVLYDYVSEGSHSSWVYEFGDYYNIFVYFLFEKA